MVFRPPFGFAETRVAGRLPTGTRRQTGKNTGFATRLFHPTSIAGLTWGVSRDFETLGPVRDFSGRLGRGESRDYAAPIYVTRRKSLSTCTKQPRPASFH